MGSDSDGDDYEGLVTLVAGRSRHCSIRQIQTHTLLLVFVEDEDSRHLRHVVDARDRWERAGRQSSSREAHTACFPSHHLQCFICVCAEMLWCSELVQTYM